MTVTDAFGRTIVEDNNKPEMVHFNVLEHKVTLTFGNTLLMFPHLGIRNLS